MSGDFTAKTGRPWTQPIGFIHSLFEMATNVMGRVDDVTDAEAVAAAIASSKVDTIVGRVEWNGQGVPPFAAKNVTKTPLVGGQWRRKDGALAISLRHARQGVGRFYFPSDVNQLTGHRLPRTRLRHPHRPRLHAVRSRGRGVRLNLLAPFILAEIPHGGRPSDSPSVREPMDDGGWPPAATVHTCRTEDTSSCV